VESVSRERTHDAREGESRRRYGGINAEQHAEVLKNLPDSDQEGNKSERLYNIEKWISITTDALTPTFEDLFLARGQVAAEAIGSPTSIPSRIRRRTPYTTRSQ